MTDRIRHRWSAAGITDEDETLITRLQRSGMLLVPRSVEIDYGEPSAIVYPLPEFMDSPVRSGMDVRQFLFEGWDAVSLAESDSSAILEQFLALSDGLAVQVKRFVETWGPMWVCDKHGTNSHYCLGPQFIFDHEPDCGCSWTPRETVDQFQLAAREVAAILSISASLMHGKIGEAKDMAALVAKNLTPGPLPERNGMYDTVEWDRFTVCSIISDRLSFNGPALAFDWQDGDDRPTLSINVGFGFLRLVWLQVAQCIAGARDIYTCDGCGVVYIRDSDRRRPKEGCRNYCEKCADTGRKRDWARRSKKSSTTP